MTTQYVGWCGIALRHADTMVGFDLFGDAVPWPDVRASTTLLCVTHGQRSYLQRERLLALGRPALEYLTELTHRRPRTRIRDVVRWHRADPRVVRQARRSLGSDHNGSRYARIHRSFTGAAAAPIDPANTVQACSA